MGKKRLLQGHQHLVFFPLISGKRKINFIYISGSSVWEFNTKIPNLKKKKKSNLQSTTVLEASLIQTLHQPMQHPQALGAEPPVKSLLTFLIPFICRPRLKKKKSSAE